MQVITSFAGNLVEDPELRFTPAGHAVLRMRVAVNDRYREQGTGEWKDADPVFVSVNAWRQLAENAAGSLHKGDQVVVVGRLTCRAYETVERERRTGYDVEADAIGAGLSYATTVVTRNARRDSINLDQPAGTVPA